MVIRWGERCDRSTKKTWEKADLPKMGRGERKRTILTYLSLFFGCRLPSLVSVSLLSHLPMQTFWTLDFDGVFSTFLRFFPPQSMALISTIDASNILDESKVMRIVSIQLQTTAIARETDAFLVNRIERRTNSDRKPKTLWQLWMAPDLLHRQTDDFASICACLSCLPNKERNKNK